MGCGCKNKKKGSLVDGKRSSQPVGDKDEYRKRVREAMKQFMDIKKQKQNLKS